MIIPDITMDNPDIMQASGTTKSVTEQGLVPGYFEWADAWYVVQFLVKSLHWVMVMVDVYPMNLCWRCW